MRFGIIAAGEGSRLVEEGLSCPKPLVKLAGTPLIERLVQLFCGIGTERVAVIVNPRNEETIRFLSALAERFPIETVIRSTDSSMHSLHAIAPMLDGDRFCVTTVDTVFRTDAFERYVHAFSSMEYEKGLMGVTSFIDDEKPLYVGVDTDMHITGYSDNAMDNLMYVSAGVYGLTPGALRILERCVNTGMSRMRRFQASLVENGYSLDAFDLGRVIDVDHIKDIAAAEALIKNCSPCIC